MLSCHGVWSRYYDFNKQMRIKERQDKSERKQAKAVWSYCLGVWDDYDRRHKNAD